MNKIRNIYISYWFHELDYNPAKKVFELQKEIESIIDLPIRYNSDEVLRNIGMPRIEGQSSDMKYWFTMSLVNAFFSINIKENLDNDEIILLINNNIQLFYDILKEIYDVHIIYSSIKLEYVDEDKHEEQLIKLLGLSNNQKYEDLSFKRGIIKNDYYINYILTYSKEYNFDLTNDENLTSQDLFDRSMLTSLSKAKLHKEFLLTVIEINDRYIYNVDASHETSKDDLRGMIMELKDILKNKLYNEI